jgi:hypothetical protein
MTRHRFGFLPVFCGQTTCFVTHFEKESGDESPLSKNQPAAKDLPAAIDDSQRRVLRIEHADLSGGSREFPYGQRNG